MRGSAKVALTIVVCVVVFAVGAHCTANRAEIGSVAALIGAAFALIGICAREVEDADVRVEAKLIEALGASLAFTGLLLLNHPAFTKAGTIVAALVIALTLSLFANRLRASK